MIGDRSRDMILKFAFSLLIFSVLEVMSQDPCSTRLKNIAVREGTVNILIDFPTNASWTLFPSGVTSTFQKDIVYYDGTVNPDCAADYAYDSASGLTIKKATITVEPGHAISTAGVYEASCVEARNNYFSFLVVRQGPTCSCNRVDSESVQLTCSSIYADHEFNPINAIFMLNVDGTSIATDTPSRTSYDSYTHISTSTFTINDTASSTYQCNLTFSQPMNAYPEYGDNAPEFNQQCSFVCPPATTTEATTTTLSSSSSATSINYQCEPSLKNMAVYEGQLNIMMNLVTDPQSVTWSVVPTSDELTLQNIIDIGGNKNPSLSDLFDVTETGLVIKMATVTGDPISTAGLYIGKCSDSTDNVGAKLLVIRTGPQCSRTSIDSGSSGVSCNITFAENVLHPIHPIVTWKLNGEFLATYTLEMEMIDPVYYAESTIATNGGAHDNYQCEVTFDAPVEIQYPWIATNAPEFKDSCSITG